MAIPLIVSALAKAGLSILGNAVLAKGKEVIEEKIGVKIPDDPLELTEAKTVELAKLQFEHEEFLINASLEETKAYLADRQDARAMQTATFQQMDEFTKRFVYYLATFWSFFAATYILSITFLEIPRANQRFADTILGFLLGTIVATILNFFFGTSQGSVKAQQFMRDMVEKVKK